MPIKFNIVNQQNDDLIKILAQLCITIQSEFDISEKTLNQLLNNDKFIQYSTFIYEQCHAELLTKIQHFKKIDNENIPISPEEFDKCGMLVTSHKNSFISYCNKHKYLHQDVSLKNNVIDHNFIKKTSDQINNERYFSIIHMIYSKYINKMFNMIHKLFIYQIESNYRQQIVSTPFDKLVNISDDLNKVISDMKNNENIFKSKKSTGNENILTNSIVGGNNSIVGKKLNIVVYSPII